MLIFVVQHFFCYPQSSGRIAEGKKRNICNANCNNNTLPISIKPWESRPIPWRWWFPQTTTATGILKRNHTKSFDHQLHWQEQPGMSRSSLALQSYDIPENSTGQAVIIIDHLQQINMLGIRGIFPFNHFPEQKHRMKLRPEWSD